MCGSDFGMHSWLDGPLLRSERLGGGKRSIVPDYRLRKTEVYSVARKNNSCIAEVLGLARNLG